MKLALVCFGLAIIIAIVNARSSKNPSLSKWEAYKAKHGKKYNSIKEEHIRKLSFLARDAAIDEHNALHDQGKTTWRQGHSHMSDLV